MRRLAHPPAAAGDDGKRLENLVEQAIACGLEVELLSGRALRRERWEGAGDHPFTLHGRADSVPYGIMRPGGQPSQSGCERKTAVSSEVPPKVSRTSPQEEFHQSGGP
jgi:hypothetical protein